MEVLQFEQKLANISIDEVERYDTGQWYTKLTVQQLIEKIPEFDWMVYLENLTPGVKSTDEAISLQCFCGKAVLKQQSLNLKYSK